MNGEYLDFEINDVAVMKVSSQEELIRKLCKIDNQIIKIFSMLASQQFFHIGPSLKESDMYKWRRINGVHSRDNTDFEEFLISRKLPDDVLKSIQIKEPNSIINRWIFTQYFIAAKNKLLTNDFYNCYQPRFEGSESEFTTLINFFKFESERHGFDPNPKPKGENCSWMVPPRIYGDLKIEEGLI
jgi:hypothetical protein